MNKFFILITAILLSVLESFAQENTQQIFTLDDFIQQVKQYHPLAKQADIQVDKALAELMSARGAFDPSLEFDASRKTFNDKNYYFYNNPQLTVPLPVGNI